MFKALTDLAKNNGQSAMGILADKLMVAVKELTAAAGNLESSVSKQGDATSAAGDAISGAVTAVKETVTNVKKDVNKMTADAKGAIDMTPLIDAIKALEDRFDTFITVKIKT
jgi:cytochrome c556